MRPLCMAVTALVAVTVLSGCYTTGTVTTRYPNGVVSELAFKKSAFDDLDVPAPDPVTGNPAAYVRIGTSRVAGETAFRMFQFSGESLRQYALDRAAQTGASDPPPTKY